MKTIKGYHFIGAHWENQSHISGLADFLQEHNSELTADGKPFFYIQHPHPKDTCNCAWAWGRDDGTVTKLLSNYPNAIAFSGHSHSPLDDDRDLWQGAFTSIGTSSLKYLYPMPARENTYQDDWSAKPPSQMAKMDPQDGRQGMVMRVYDSAITFEKREFVYDEPIGEAWYLPWPISVTQPLSFENRAKTAAIPQFPAGTKVTVTGGSGADRYGTSQKQVTVHFPTVLKKNAGVRAFDYEVQVEYDWLDVRHVTATKRVFSPKCYLGENKEDRPYVLEQAANHTLSVRTKAWKYIPPSQGPAIISGPNMESGYSREPQLYDMRQPYEQENLALKQPQVVFEMQSYIEKERTKGSSYKSPISK